MISLRNTLSLPGYRRHETHLRIRQASCLHLPWHSEVSVCPPPLSHKLLAPAQNPAQQHPLGLCTSCAHPGSVTIALLLTGRARPSPRSPGPEHWILLKDPFSCANPSPVTSAVTRQTSSFLLAGHHGYPKATSKRPASFLSTPLPSLPGRKV